MAKILFTGDWHADHKTFGVERFAEIEASARNMVSDAIARDIDLFCFLGDLSDPDSAGLTIRSINLARECMIDLNMASIPSIWIAGNHDVLEDGSSLSNFDLLPSFGKASVVSDACSVVSGLLNRNDEPLNLSVIACPFTASSNPYDANDSLLELSQDIRDDKLLILGHFTIPGIEPGEETTEVPRGRNVLIPYASIQPLEKKFSRMLIANGHYHKRHIFKSKECTTPILIPGSPVKLTFGEAASPHGYLIAEM